MACSPCCESLTSGDIWHLVISGLLPGTVIMYPFMIATYTLQFSASKLPMSLPPKYCNSIFYDEFKCSRQLGYEFDLSYVRMELCFDQVTEFESHVKSQSLSFRFLKILVQVKFFEIFSMGVQIWGHEV